MAVKTRLLLLSPLLLTACTSMPPTVTPAPPTASAAGPTADPSAEVLDVTVTNSELAVGEERVALRIYNQSGSELVGTGYDVQVIVYRTEPQSGSQVQVASGEALYFGLGVPDAGAWVVYTEFDSSGPWALEVIAEDQAGKIGRGRKDIIVAGRPLTPRVGAAPPSGESPVLEGESIEEITSDKDPDPDLYSMTVGEAAASGRPTVVHFGSPGHCPTEVCRLTLAQVKTVKAQYGSRVNFIHVETRDLSDPTQLSPTTLAWKLPSEPWTFVLKKHGKVAARFEGPLDRTELGLIVDHVLEVE